MTKQEFDKTWRRLIARYGNKHKEDKLNTVLKNDLKESIGQLDFNILHHGLTLMFAERASGFFPLETEIRQYYKRIRNGESPDEEKKEPNIIEQLWPKIRLLPLERYDEIKREAIEIAEEWCWKKGLVCMKRLRVQYEMCRLYARDNNIDFPEEEIEGIPF